MSVFVFSTSLPPLLGSVSHILVFHKVKWINALEDSHLAFVLCFLLFKPTAKIVLTVLTTTTTNWKTVGRINSFHPVRSLTLSTLSGFLPLSAPTVSLTFWPRSAGENKRRNVMVLTVWVPFKACQWLGDFNWGCIHLDGPSGFLRSLSSMLSRSNYGDASCSY